MLDPLACFTKLQLTLLLPFSSAQAAKRVQRTRGSHWWRKEALPSAHGVAQAACRGRTGAKAFVRQPIA